MSHYDTCKKSDVLTGLQNQKKEKHYVAQGIAFTAKYPGNSHDRAGSGFVHEKLVKQNGIIKVENNLMSSLLSMFNFSDIFPRSRTRRAELFSNRGKTFLGVCPGRKVLPRFLVGSSPARFLKTLNTVFRSKIQTNSMRKCKAHPISDQIGQNLNLTSDPSSLCKGVPTPHHPPLPQARDQHNSPEHN